jgi:hypothetical protein
MYGKEMETCFCSTFTFGKEAKTMLGCVKERLYTIKNNALK